MGNVNQRPIKKPETTQEPEDQESSSTFTTFTWEICIEPVIHPNKVFKNSNKCVHPFCTDCMINYIQVKLEDNVSDIKCPALTCDHSLEPLSWGPKIPNQLFSRWCDLLCDSVLLGLESVYCPYRECSALVINECIGGRGDLKRCECPNCKKLFCFRCKVPWHAGYTCEESGEIMDPNDIKFGVLSETERWMRCPECKHCIERTWGCKQVRCRCGTSFCYQCGEKSGGGWCTCKLQISEILCECFILFIIFLHFVAFVVFVGWILVKVYKFLNSL